MSKIAIIRTSPRDNGNTNIMADEFKKGAMSCGHEVADINLNQEQVGYCHGCYGTDSDQACVITGKCWQQDSMNKILATIKDCDALAFATPIYFYSASGQMKVFLDRTIPLYGRDPKFKDVFLLTACEEGSRPSAEGAIHVLMNWVKCFPNARMAGTAIATGVLEPGAVSSNTFALKEAYRLGTSVK